MSDVKKEDTKNGLIFAAVAITSIVLVGMVIGVIQLFDITVDAEINRKVLTVENAQLKQLRATEEQKLAHYQWADKKNGVVRVPLDRAAELVLKDAENPPPPPAPVAAPAVAVDGGVKAPEAGKP